MSFFWLPLPALNTTSNPHVSGADSLACSPVKPRQQRTCAMIFLICEFGRSVKRAGSPGFRRRRRASAKSGAGAGACSGAGGGCDACCACCACCGFCGSARGCASLGSSAGALCSACGWACSGHAHDQALPIVHECALRARFVALWLKARAWPNEIACSNPRLDKPGCTRPCNIPNTLLVSQHEDT